MPTYDFDFLRYVERRRGAREAEQREAAAYAYAGDLLVRRTLLRLRPVTLSLEATAQLWQASARAELLGTAILAGADHYPRVAAAAKKCAALLHVTPPPVFVSPHLLLTIHTFGTDEEPHVVLHAELAESLTDEELLYALGAEIGRVQNGHVLLGTAYHYLERSAPSFARWIVRPARAALSSYLRRADITADRAGLLCCRDLATATRTLARIAVDPSAVASDDKTTLADGDRTMTRETARRITALEIFARSAYYLGVRGEPGGTNPSETDRLVGKALRGDGESGPKSGPGAGSDGKGKDA